jgi:plastocyanin
MLLIAVVINIPAAGFSPILLIVVLLVAAFFVFSWGSWGGKRWGYLGGIIPTIIVLLLFGSPTEVLANPANSEFALAFTFYVASLASILYGVYGFLMTRRPLSEPKQISRSSAAAFVALGVVIGGLLVGSFAGATQTRLLSGTGGQADITIVLGAGSKTTGAFQPATFTVKVGATVTWYNADASTHTATSTTSVFDSGNLGSGAIYKYTFTKAGTYDYYCVIHPNMKGTVVVSP